VDVVYFNPYNVPVSGRVSQEAAAGVLTLLGKIMTGKIMMPEPFFKLLAVRFVIFVLKNAILRCLLHGV